MNTISVRFDVLHAYAEQHRLDFNELCRAVRDAIAEGSRAARDSAAEAQRPNVPPVPAPSVATVLTDAQIEAIAGKDELTGDAILSFARDLIAALSTSSAAEGATAQDLTCDPCGPESAESQATTSEPGAPWWRGHQAKTLEAVRQIMRTADAYAFDYAKEGKLAATRTELEIELADAISAAPQANTGSK